MESTLYKRIAEQVYAYRAKYGCARIKIVMSPDCLERLLGEDETSVSLELRGTLTLRGVPVDVSNTVTEFVVVPMRENEELRREKFTLTLTHETIVYGEHTETTEAEKPIVSTIYYGDDGVTLSKAYKAMRKPFERELRERNKK